MEPRVTGSKNFEIVKRNKLIAYHFYRFKDKIPLCLHSNIVYKFGCGRCNNIYHTQNWRDFKVRAAEHSGILPLTNKCSKSKK